MVGLVNEFLDVYEQAAGGRFAEVEPGPGDDRGHDLLERVQEWYASRCTGEGPWEHKVCLANVGEPDGWFMRVDPPPVMGERLREAMRLIDGRAIKGEPWLDIRTHENAFIGACSPLRLEELVSEFFGAWERAVGDVSSM